MNIKSKKFSNLYLDTNILRQLYFNIHEDPRITNLKVTFLEPLKIKIHIPKIVLDEITKHWVNYIREKYNSVSTAVETINKYINSNLCLNLNELNQLLVEVRDNIEANIKKAGIEIFNNPFASMDLEQIVNMAINERKPFGKEGKGFQDMIILLSVIEHCKQNANAENIFLSTNKNDFDNKDIIETIESSGIKLKLFFL